MGERETTCCFTGHRPTKLPWGYRENDPRCLALKARLRAAVEAAYDRGMRHFICGMAQGCDFYFCEAVLQLRADHAGVTLEAAIPCPDQCSRWPDWQKERYRRLVSLCDVKTVICPAYSPVCMQERNAYMVDHAGMLLAVSDGLPGGSASTVAYARAQGLEIVCLPSVLPAR